MSQRSPARRRPSLSCPQTVWKRRVRGSQVAALPGVCSAASAAASTARRTGSASSKPSTWWAHSQGLHTICRRPEEVRLTEAMAMSGGPVRVSHMWQSHCHRGTAIHCGPPPGDGWAKTVSSAQASSSSLTAGPSRTGSFPLTAGAEDPSGTAGPEAVGRAGAGGAAGGAARCPRAVRHAVRSRSTAGGGATTVTPAPVSIWRSSSHTRAERSRQRANAERTWLSAPAADIPVTDRRCASAAVRLPLSSARPKCVTVWQSVHRHTSLRSRCTARASSYSQRSCASSHRRRPRSSPRPHTSHRCPALPLTMRRSRSQSRGATHERTLVNQHDRGTRSTNSPDPNPRSSPGRSGGRSGSATHRSRPGSPARGANQRLAAGSQRAPSALASSFSAKGTSSQTRATPPLLDTRCSRSSPGICPPAGRTPPPSARRPAGHGAPGAGPRTAPGAVTKSGPNCRRSAPCSATRAGRRSLG